MTRIVKYDGQDHDVKRIYVATPVDGLTFDQRLETVKRVRLVLDRDWKAVERYFPLAEQIDEYGEIEFASASDMGVFKRIHELNSSELQRCDMIVAFNPGLSVGVNYEIGWFDAVGKPVKGLRVA